MPKPIFLKRLHDLPFVRIVARSIAVFLLVYGVSVLAIVYVRPWLGLQDYSGSPGQTQVEIAGIWALVYGIPKLYALLKRRYTEHHRQPENTW